MNQLIVLRPTKPNGRSLGAIRAQTGQTHAARAPLLARAHGLGSIGPRSPRKTRPSGAWTVLARERACVVHRTPKRLRLKVPPRRHDEAFFAGLQQELIKQRGIISVDLNSLTGSVVIVHDGTLDPRPKKRQPRQGRASQVNFAAGRGSTESSNRDANLASLAIKLVLAAITRELSSLIVELILIA
jgi:hypothetical protein